MREYLKRNTTLNLTEDSTNNSFKIVVGDVIGEGASCVVYNAIRIAGNEKYRIRLKQFNPLFSNYDVSRFEEGVKKNIDIQNTMPNSTSKVFFFCKDDNDNPFIIVDYDNGTELSRLESIPFADFTKACKETAITLKEYHEKGWLHLDIKPDNILIINSGSMQGVKLFDFDSVIQKSELKNDDTVISCSKNYAAPEVRQSNKSKISEKSDFYSVGAMMFEFLFGRAPRSIDRSVISMNRDFSSVKVLDCVNPKVKPLLKDFLNKTITSAEARRYNTDDELIGALDEIVKASREENYLISSFHNDTTYFVGRKEEISKIHKILQDNNYVFVNGMGGIGKSELVKAYAKEYEKHYSTISFGVFTDSLMLFVNDDSVINIANYSNNGELSENQYFGSKLNMLSKIVSKDNLIIVDNFENLEEENLKKLLNLNCKLIFTTRDSNPGDFGYRCVYIEELSEQELSKVFWKWYTIEEKTPKTQELVKELISLVNYHTLAVELLARQMDSSFITLTDMLNRLHENGLSNSGVEEIRYKKDQSIYHDNIIGIFKRIFSISRLNYNQKYILKNLAMLPALGINALTFKECCELENFNEINKLEKMGWIKKNASKIALHPIIAEVILLSFEFSVDDVKRMLDNLSDRFDSTNSEMIDIANHTSFVLLDSASDLLSVLSCCHKIIYSSLSLLNKIGSFDKARTLFVKAVPFRENNLLEKEYISIELIANVSYILFEGLVLYKERGEFSIAKTIFHEMSKHLSVCPTELELEVNYEYANILSRQHRFDEAINLYGKNELLLPMISDKGSMEYARLYNEIGIVLSKQGRAREAIETHQKSLSIIEKQNANDKSFADVHRRLAKAYSSMDDYEAAIEEYNKALEYKDVDNVYSYIYIFECYAKLKNYDNFDKAKNYALEYCQKQYGKDSYFVERVLSHCVDAYIEFGEYEKAIEVAEQALELEKSLFLMLSYNVAWGYYNLAKAHYYAGNYDKAELYCGIASQCKCTEADKDSYFDAKNFMLVAKIKCALKDKTEEYQYYSKAAGIFISYGDYKSATDATLRIADMHLNLEDSIRAINYYQEANSDRALTDEIKLKIKELEG